MASTGIEHRRGTFTGARLAAVVSACTVACGWLAAAHGDLAAPTATVPLCSVTADRPDPRGAAPPAMPMIAETEISVEDFDPNEPSSHPRLGTIADRRTCVGIHAPGISRRCGGPTIRVADSTDLVRLCRLLL